ncbi:MAG TPA: nicotinate-nucleotide--dimethylbenzimidazole phosphoribosyltransferase [Pirellulales bacterium]
MLADTLQRIGPLDARAMAAMQARLDALTKPPGSLGRLEALAVQLAGISGRVPPVCDERAVLVFAADHGVVAEGVSAYPAEVTRQMVLNFLAGGAAINALARQAGAKLIVVDAGVVGDLPPHANLVSRKIARGTQNFVHAPAMTRDEALRAVELGIGCFEPCQAVALGEMGIGNSTAAAAIVAAATGCSAAEAVGPGTGIDAAGRERKISAIQRALALHQPDAGDGLALLSAVGGFEIGALAGAMLAAAAARVPAVIDGFICTAAALVAARLCPAVREYLIAAHVSSEPGHPLALADLGLRPLLQLDMRLGEGTGAVLALHLLDAACRIAGEMATFDEAHVSRRQP